MKWGSLVLVSSLVLVPALGVPSAHAGLSPRARAYHAGRLHPQKLRLARRLHTAMRRLPHHHGARVVSATLDDVINSQNVVTTAPGDPGYAWTSREGNTVDVWTDRQGHIRQSISTGRD